MNSIFDYMLKRLFLFLSFFVLSAPVLFAQQVLNGTLIKGDKLFIKHDYDAAVIHYVKYLKEYPKDYYASRQAALCYDKLNRPNDAIDYWPVVVESSEVTEKDYLQYAKSLLANDREPEARRIFSLLSHSSDKGTAAWGKAYMNPETLFKDSASCRVIEIKGINTDKSELCPVIFKEKLLSVYDKGKLLRIYNALTDLETQTISGAVKKDSVTFFPALLYEKLQTKNVNSQFCFSDDGLTLYFSKAVSNKTLGTKSENPFWKFQLFALSMNTLNDAKPDIKPFKFNSPDFDLVHPSISADGKQLYFASDMKGSMGGKDIFMCELIGGEWGPPKNLGSQINSPGNDVFPHITQEGVLYFASDTRPGLGGLDLFYAQPSGDAETLFNDAQNAGANMNTRFDDFGIYVLKGGKKGYLSSNRKNNTDDDIYFFTKSN